MNELPLLLLHEALCMALFYAVFCRARLTSAKTTRLEVRLVLVLEGTIASVGMYLPVAHDFQPSVFSVLLLLVMVLPKVVFARVWTRGVPQTCLKDTVNG